MRPNPREDNTTKPTTKGTNEEIRTQEETETANKAGKPLQKITT